MYDDDDRAKTAVGRDTQVQGEMDRLSARTDQLQKLASELSERVAPYCAPREEVPVRDGGSPESEVDRTRRAGVGDAPMAQRLRDIGERLDTVGRRLARVIEEFEG